MSTRASPARAETQPQTEAKTKLPRSISRGALSGIANCVFILAVALLALSRVTAPEPVASSAPESEFSAYRAIEHVRVIAKSPHPIGSAEQARVRDYLLESLSRLGLSGTVQDATVVGAASRGFTSAGRVQNVVARLQGTANSGCVLLVAHYDSAANSQGANDDGSGVAAVLETLRALKVGNTLRNDLIILLTDGEESGLLGARAFMAEHPWAKDVGVALNFEARGCKGPAFMFETSRRNGWLIDRMSEAASHPFAASYMSDIYRLLANSTDFTVIRLAGIPGFNIAHIGGNSAYHTQLDKPENVSLGSLQHQGLYALQLTRLIGNLDLTDIHRPDAVYFDLFGIFLFHYSVSWIFPVTITVALLFGGVVFLGLRSGRLSKNGIALGFAAAMFNALAAGIVSLFVLLAARTMTSGKDSILLADTPASHLCFLAMICLTVAVFSIISRWAGAKSDGRSLMAGALVWWLLLMVASSVLLPGASYLFAYPLLFSTAVLALLSASKSEATQPMYIQALVLVCVAPSIILMVPMIYEMYIAVGLNRAAIPLSLVALLEALLVYQLLVLTRTRGWLLSAGAIVSAIALMGCCALTSKYSESLKKPDSVFYALDADHNTGVWASLDAKPDEWTNQFFAGVTERNNLREFVPNSARAFLTSPAPSAILPAPQAAVLEESENGGERTVRLRITSARGAPIVSIYGEKDSGIVSAAINGHSVESSVISGTDDAFAVRYYALPPEGIELSLQVTARPCALRVVDQSYGLPEFAGTELRPRPPYLMPSPFFHFNQDSTMVGKSFTF